MNIIIIKTYGTQSPFCLISGETCLSCHRTEQEAKEVKATHEQNNK